MSVRADLDVLPQPFRWLAAHPALGWGILGAMALWLRARQSRVNLPPLSSEWLHDLERQTHRGRDF